MAVKTGRGRLLQAPILTVRSHRFLFCILLILVAMLAASVPASAQGSRHEVLYINSYHEGLDWSDPITRAIEDRFTGSGLDINLHVEFMDSKRYSDENYKKILFDLYKDKYANKKFDVILCSDDDALDFLLQYGDQLFPGTPIIFSGVNYYTVNRLEGHANITGVAEHYDVRSTLDTALLLHPGTSHVFIINDLTTAGRANKQNIDTIIPKYPRTITFTYLGNYSMPELEETVGSLPDHSIILLMTFNRDRLGSDYSYTDSIRLIRGHTTVPIYGIWETYLGQGIVGGMLTGSYEQGNISAGMALRVLNGENVNAIPVFTDPKNRYMFDAQELRRFNINPEDLPEGSIIINQPQNIRLVPESELWVIFMGISGLIVGIAIMIIALLRIRRTRDALDASEKRYRAVVEDQTELISRFLPDGTHLFANDAYCRFYHKTRESIIGKKFFPQIPDEEKMLVHKHLQSLTPENPIRSMTNRIWLSNGESRWLFWNNRAIFDKDGNVVEYQSVGRDITDVRLAEDKVRQYSENLESLIDQRTQELVNSNAKLQQEVAERTLTENLLATEKEQLAVTLKSIGDGVITTDTDGQVVLVNQIAERITGWKQSDAEKQPLQKILPLYDIKDKKPLATPTDRIIQHPEMPDLLHRVLLITSDGTERILEESASVIRDKKSSIIGVVVVFRDITDRQKFETEMQRTQKLESLGLLAGGIAHDFNNILTAIFGNIILAKMEVDHESPGYKRLIEAENAMVRAKELTQQLLTFSKGGAPVKETADISNLIIDSTQFMMSGSQSRCEFDIAPELWPTDVDTGQISQVINNIVINANHAMPHGGVLHVSAANVILTPVSALPLPTGRYVKIMIRDEGTGISKENLARIFDPYYTTKKQGSGLGLSSASSIIRKHNGYIDVESEIGKGTTFSLYLPASDKTLEPVAKLEASPKTGSGYILVMDDEEAIRDVASRLLEHMGYRVEVAGSGEDAIELYRQALDEGDPLDVVIMDLTIPGGMGGKEAIAKLKEIDKNVKVIVSSGYSNDPIMANFQDYGFVGVLTKPYSRKEMAAAIERALQHDPDPQED
ncbi:MAG: PAS domain S-box protein [Methanoregula sp.]